MGLLSLFQLNLGGAKRARYRPDTRNVRNAEPLERIVDAQPLMRITHADSLQRELPA